MENKNVRIKPDIIDKLENAKHQISLDDEDLEHYQEAIDDAIEIVKSSIIPEPVKKLTRKEQGKIICEHLKHDGDDLDETVMISSVWDALKEIEKINGSKDIKVPDVIRDIFDNSRQFADLTDNEMKYFCKFAFDACKIDYIRRNSNLDSIDVGFYTKKYPAELDEITFTINGIFTMDLSMDKKYLNNRDYLWRQFLYANGINPLAKDNPFINKSKIIETSKRVIGYDDCGKPLHEGDFCTFDVNASDWRFKPDNIRKSGLATLEGQVTYNEQDKCFELSIDNDYCPALYFHAIEPGTLRVKETKEQIKNSIRINPDKISFLEISNEATCKIARLYASPELDKIIGIYTEKSHEFAFSVNYYARLQDTNEFDVIACVEINNNNWLRRDFPDVADKVIKLADTYRNIEPVVIPLNKEELNIIEEKFNDYYINVYGNDDIER